MPKITSFCALVVLLVGLSAAAASAHAAFVGAPSGVPAGSEQTLAMGVPHERDDTTYNVDVVIAMPTGWQPIACQTKPTWTCTVGSSGGRQVVHFVKAVGSSAAEDETFQFSVRAATTVGSFSFPTVQTYNTGEVVRWIDAPGGAEPAPILATLPSGVAPETTAPTTTVDHSPAPTTPPPTAPAPTAAAPTTTSSGATPTTTPPAVATSTSAPTIGSVTTTSSTATTAVPASTTIPDLGVAGDDDGGGSGLAIGLAAGAVAVAGAIRAGIIVRRRRSHPTSTR